MPVRRTSFSVRHIQGRAVGKWVPQTGAVNQAAETRWNHLPSGFVPFFGIWTQPEKALAARSNHSNRGWTDRAGEPLPKSYFLPVLRQDSENALRRTRLAPFRELIERSEIQDEHPKYGPSCLF